VHDVEVHVVFFFTTRVVSLMGFCGSFPSPPCSTVFASTRTTSCGPDQLIDHVALA
jgi:hypothetical protein